jgi:predicted metal-dependent hydrolase
VPDELHLSVDDTVALAQRHLDSGRPFHAHEVLEALWKTQPASERDLWQGLAQIAVGLTHAMRGNTVGATTLLRRGAGRVANYGGDPHDIDIVGVLAWAEALASAPGTATQPLILRDAS